MGCVGSAAWTQKDELVQPIACAAASAATLDRKAEKWALPRHAWFTYFDMNELAQMVCRAYTAEAREETAAVLSNRRNSRDTTLLPHCSSPDRRQHQHPDSRSRRHQHRRRIPVFWHRLFALKMRATRPASTSDTVLARVSWVRCLRARAPGAFGLITTTTVCRISTW